MLKNLSNPVGSILEVTCPVINTCVTEIFNLMLTPLHLLTDSGQENSKSLAAVAEGVEQSHIKSEPPKPAKVLKKAGKRSDKTGKKEAGRIKKGSPTSKNEIKKVENRPAKTTKTEPNHIEPEPPVFEDFLDDDDGTFSLN